MSEVPARARTSRRRLAASRVAMAPGFASRDRTTLDHLPLGRVFSWQNRVPHGVGVLAGVALDRLLVRPFAA